MPQVKKVERLRKNAQFHEVFKCGKAFVGRKIVVYVLKNALPYNRVGITVSRKLGGAVERNQLKRIIKEIWRARENELRKGFDFVLVPRMKAKSASFQEIADELKQLLVKSKTIQVVAGNRKKPDIVLER